MIPYQKCFTKWIRNALESLDGKNKGNGLRFPQKIWRTFLFWLAPPLLFRCKDAMKIRIKKEEFHEIMKHQLRRYELGTVQRREKISLLVENMRRS